MPTQADLDAIDAAILAKIKGERVTALTFSDRQESRSDASLEELYRARDLVAAQLGAVTTPRPRRYLLSGSKGTEC